MHTQYNTQRNIIHSWIEENIAICDNMDGHWDYYAKQNKSKKDK